MDLRIFVVHNFCQVDILSLIRIQDDSLEVDRYKSRRRCTLLGCLWLDINYSVRKEMGCRGFDWLQVLHIRLDGFHGYSLVMVVNVKRTESFCDNRLRLGWQNEYGSPVKPSRHEHVGKWFRTKHSAFGAQLLGHGFWHLFWTQFKFNAQSLFVVHSGRQPVYGSP